MNDKKDNKENDGGISMEEGSVVKGGKGTKPTTPRPAPPKGQRSHSLGVDVHFPEAFPMPEIGCFDPAEMMDGMRKEANQNILAIPRMRGHHLNEKYIVEKVIAVFSRRLMERYEKAAEKYGFKKD